MTDAQLAANRANAQLSTGPKTDEGKARSSKNSIKHGIFCKDLLMPGEDEETLRNLRNGMLLSFNPKNEAELMLVDRIIDASWRLQRVRSAEHAFFSSQQTHLQDDEELCDDPAITLSLLLADPKDSTLERYQRYSSKLERQMHQAINQLRAMRKEQTQPNEASEMTRSMVQNQAAQNEPAKAQAPVIAASMAAPPLKYEPAPGRNPLSHENLMPLHMRSERNRQIDAILEGVLPRR
jgi:hypothetical protein